MKRNIEKGLKHRRKGRIECSCKNFLGLTCHTALPFILHPYLTLSPRDILLLQLRQIQFHPALNGSDGVTQGIASSSQSLFLGADNPQPGDIAVYYHNSCDFFRRTRIRVNTPAAASTIAITPTTNIGETPASSVKASDREMIPAAKPELSSLSSPGRNAASC